MEFRFSRNSFLLWRSIERCWRRRWESNPRMAVLQTAALTTWLRRLICLFFKKTSAKLSPPAQTFKKFYAGGLKYFHTPLVYQHPSDLSLPILCCLGCLTPDQFETHSRSLTTTPICACPSRILPLLSLF